MNIIWALFLLSGLLGACWQSLLGNWDVWQNMVSALFGAAKSGFEISLGLTGLLCFWLGLLKIAEASGLTDKLARGLTPLFQKIMPSVPADSPAIGSIVMNMAANMLGLDNAATPMGLRAMEQLQAINPHPERASAAQTMFMVLNASSVTIIPITILLYRAELGCSNPSAVFVPILLATSISTLVGFLAVALVQRLNLCNRVIFGWGCGFALFITGVCWGFLRLPAAERMQVSAVVSNCFLVLAIGFFVAYGCLRRLNVYEVFIKGAKDGFGVAVQIIPYLVATLAAIAVFRASGALDALVSGIAHLVQICGIDSGFVPALPTAFLKPLSGSGARAMMIETMQTYGADSFPSFVTAVMQGSTETTFYVLAVYFGAVKISKTGAALPCALLADAAGLIAAICFSYCFFAG